MIARRGTVGFSQESGPWEDTHAPRDHPVLMCILEALNGLNTSLKNIHKRT